MQNLIDPPAIVRAAEDLAALASKANAEHEAGERLTRKGLGHYRAAGEALLKAKAQCGHGKWLDWLKANVKFSGRTARDYIRLAENWEKLAAAANLRGALRLLSAPLDEQCDEVDAGEHLAAADEVEPHPLAEWRATWREAGVWFPAASGRELKRRMQADPIFGFLVADSPDEGDEFWRKLLLEILREPAAAHLLRTGKHLPPTPQSNRPLTQREWYCEKDETSVWRRRVEVTAGKLLMCQESAAEPRLETLKGLFQSEFEKTLSDQDLAVMFEVTEAELPAALTNWMYGHFYSFIYTTDQLEALISAFNQNLPFPAGLPLYPIGN
jgi:hypothetical protein